MRGRSCAAEVALVTDFLFADDSKLETQNLLQLRPPALAVSQCSRAKCYKAVSGGTEVCLLWLVLIADRSPHANRSFLSFASLARVECCSSGGQMCLDSPRQYWKWLGDV